jgi:hypothetical protein
MQDRLIHSTHACCAGWLQAGQPRRHGIAGENMAEFLRVGRPLGMARNSARIAAAGLMAAVTLPARAQTSTPVSPTTARSMRSVTTTR